MTVRAKFTCGSKVADENGREGGRLAFYPVISGSPENEKFYQYTPSGTIRFDTIRQEVFDQFEQGADYYVDFTKASPPAKAPEASTEPPQPTPTEEPVPTPAAA